MSVNATMPARARLLVVEDDDATRDSLIDVLTDEGFDVTTASDGCEGLSCALAQAPDAIITDLMMPRCDGDSLIAALAADPRLASVPVLVITASGVTPPEHARGHLRKPFDATQLLDAVEVALAS